MTGAAGGAGRARDAGRPDPRRQRGVEQPQAAGARPRRRARRRPRTCRRPRRRRTPPPWRRRSAAFGDAGAIDAVGHRIVHGGTIFSGPVLIDARVVRPARRPHGPRAAPPAEVARRAGRRLRRRSRTCRRSPASTRRSTRRCRPPPRPTRCRPSGASAGTCAGTGSTGCRTRTPRAGSAELLGRPAKGLRVVTCHLGAGASLAAVLDGRSVDTTMGFTPLEGLVMATRSGSVDPGLVLWLLEHVGMPPAELAATLEHRSGLLGPRRDGGHARDPRGRGRR